MTPYIFGEQHWKINNLPFWESPKSFLFQIGEELDSSFSLASVSNFLEDKFEGQHEGFGIFPIYWVCFWKKNLLGLISGLAEVFDFCLLKLSLLECSLCVKLELLPFDKFYRLACSYFLKLSFTLLALRKRAEASCFSENQLQPTGSSFLKVSTFLLKNFIQIMAEQIIILIVTHHNYIWNRILEKINWLLNYHGEKSHSWIIEQRKGQWSLTFSHFSIHYLWNKWLQLSFITFQFSDRQLFYTKLWRQIEHSPIY